MKKKKAEVRGGQIMFIFFIYLLILSYPLGPMRTLKAGFLHLLLIFYLRNNRPVQS